MSNKSLLFLIFALLGLAGCGFLGQKSSFGRQTWEYKTIVRARAFPMGNTVQTAVAATDWNQWFEDGKALTAPVDPLAKINDLGGQGWELISITPRSSLASDWTAGTTSDETWVFKRPR